ncbi:hypothetical protein BG004_002294, partial [Podila humilis]
GSSASNVSGKTPALRRLITVRFKIHTAKCTGSTGSMSSDSFPPQALPNMTMSVHPRPWVQPNLSSGPTHSKRKENKFNGVIQSTTEPDFLAMIAGRNIWTAAPTTVAAAAT